MGSSSFEESRSRNQSSSEGGSKEQVWGTQAPFLESMFRQAQGLAGDQMGGMGNIDALGADVLQRGRASVDAMMPFTTGQAPEQQMMMERAKAGNPELQALIDSLGNDINRNLGLQLKTIGEQAGGYGARGGGRSGVAMGLAGEAATREFSDAATKIRYGDYQTQNALLESLTQSRMNAGAQMPAQLSNLFNLGTMPMQARWAPLANLSGVLGAPVSLGESFSRSQSSGSSDAIKTGMDFG